MKKHRYIMQAALIVTFLLMHSAKTIRANEPNWPQFRGPGGLGIAPDNQAYPTTLDMSKNLLWKTEVPKGHSSPCIWGDNIFITARSGKKLETICINRRNGKIKWRKSVEPEKLEKISGSNSHAAPTPVCNAKRVYVHFGSFGLLAYDVNGNELWRKPLPLSNVAHGSASSPVLVNNMVVINRDPDGPNYGGRRKEGEYILAVDQNTGETIWRQERRMDSPGWSTPVLWKHGNEQELVVLGGGHLISYDLKDGHKRWWFDNLPSVMGVALTPVYTEDTLFVAVAVGRSGDPVNPIELPGFNELIEMYDSDKDNRLIQAEIPDDLSLIYRRGPEVTGVKRRFSQLDTDQDGAIGEVEWNKVVIDTKNISPGQMDALIAIRSGGKDDVSQSHERWRAYEGIGQVSSPLFYQGRIYLVKHGGNVTCYDAKTGDKIYGDRAGPRAYYFASPVAADNKIYFCSSNGIIIVVQAGDKFRILAQNKIRERIYATPALVDGKIYLRTDKNMYAFISAKDDSGQTPRDIVAKVENNQAKTLYEAAADGNIALVKSLIAGGADVNTPNIWGWTPLYVAVVIGNGDIVNLLIAKGANVDAPNNQGETPLRLAIGKGRRNIVKLLIENGADFRTADKNGVTPLHTTAEQGDIDTATLLIDNGADVNAKDKWIWTPLHYACWKNHKDMAEFLITKGADINTKNEDGQTPLLLAIGQKDIVELLIDKGADINTKNNNGQTPLHLAARNGQKDLVERLLTKGADVKAQNSNSRTSIGLAQEKGHAEIVELLIKHANQSGDSKEIMTFYDYAAVGDIEQVKSFVSKGMDVNAKTQAGTTPLHFAVSNGHRDIAEYLISKGADINTKNSDGQTLLHRAAISGQKDVVELLLTNGADVNAKDKDSMTPLHYACWRNHKDTAEFLIIKGANLNVKGIQDYTALGIATVLGRTEIVELLRKHGAKE